MVTARTFSQNVSKWCKMKFGDELRALSREAGAKRTAEFEHWRQVWLAEAMRVAREAAKSHRLKACFFPKHVDFDYEQSPKEICQAIAKILEEANIKTTLVTGRGMPYISMDWSDNAFAV